MKRLCLLLAGVALPAVAQTSDLPPPELVNRALDAQPLVAAAVARVEAAEADGMALAGDPHEVTAQASLSRRTVDREGDYAEYDATLSKAIRLPGKARLDRQAGALGVEVARDHMEDARHQVALKLAQLWYDWLTASELHHNASELVANHRALVRMTAARVDVRDAAQLELDQVEAALALAEAQQGDAAAQRDRARALLETQLPDLPLPPEAPRVAAPGLPAEGLGELQRLIVARSHEIGAAAASAKRQQVLAARARADRVADPTLGLRLIRERNGQEQGVGLVASLPLGGGHRRALADRAAAEATAARADLAGVERTISGTALADVAEFRSRLSAWTSSVTAVRRAEASAALSARGQLMGALDLADRLYAERQANEARAQETLARSAAARLLLKLRIDAHVMWIE